jgi:hypothetical protein
VNYFLTALSLISEAEEELKRLEAMEKEIAKIKRDKPIKWSEIYDVEKRYSPIPRKSVINDNIKIARRLLLRAYVK